MTSNFLALQTVSVQCLLILHQKAETPLVTKKALSNNSVRTANMFTNLQQILSTNPKLLKEQPPKYYLIKIL